MPKGAKILHVQSQNMSPHLWAEVDTEARVVKRWFRVYGTGAEICVDDTERIEYRCTFPMAASQLIWHLFEEL